MPRARSPRESPNIAHASRGLVADHAPERRRRIAAFDRLEAPCFAVFAPPGAAPCCSVQFARRKSLFRLRLGQASLEESDRLRQRHLGSVAQAALKSHLATEACLFQRLEPGCEVDVAGARHLACVVRQVHMAQHVGHGENGRSQPSPVRPCHRRHDTAPQPPRRLGASSTRSG